MKVPGHSIIGLQPFGRSTLGFLQVGDFRFEIGTKQFGVFLFLPPYWFGHLA